MQRRLRAEALNCVGKEGQCCSLCTALCGARSWHLSDCEQVESGYRLVMLYSLCLHPDTQFSVGRRLSGSARNQLVVAIGELTKRKKEVQAERATAGEETIVALMLSPSCKKSEVESSGSMVLTGEDRERFELLTAANALLPHEHQLKLYIVCLRFKLLGYDKEEQVQESILWYSTSGGEMDSNLPTSPQWTKRFSFLNPGNKTFGQLWRSSQAHGARVHERLSIVGRPMWADTIRPLAVARGVARFYNDDIVTRIPLRNPQKISTQSPKSGPQQDTKETRNKRQSAQVELCQDLANNIIASGDITLVEPFFKFSFARQKEKRTIIPAVADIVKRVGWDNVSTFLLGGISDESFEDRIGIAMGLAEQLDANAIAQEALTTFAVEKARMLFCTFPEKLLALPELQLLFKHALACADPEVLVSAAALFNAFGGKQLGSIVDALSKSVDKSTPPSQRIPIAPIFLRRRHWLIKQIERIKNIERVDDPFSWEMVDTDFPDAGAIATFLQGPNTCLIIRGFGAIDDAMDRISVLSAKIIAPIEITAHYGDLGANVQILRNAVQILRKCGVRQSKYKAELERLNKLLVNENTADEGDTVGCSNNTTGKKRPRDDEPHVIEIDE